MKKLIVYVCLIVFLLAVNVQADTIIFKDGRKKIEVEETWEEGDQIKCYRFGSVVGYPKDDVEIVEGLTSAEKGRIIHERIFGRQNEISEQKTEQKTEQKLSKKDYCDAVVIAGKGSLVSAEWMDSLNLWVKVDNRFVKNKKEIKELAEVISLKGVKLLKQDVCVHMYHGDYKAITRSCNTY